MVAAFRTASLLLCFALQALGGEPVLQAGTGPVACQDPLEFKIDWNRSYTNPFDPAQVQADLEVTHASGERFRVPAFFTQDYERARSPGQGRGPTWLYPSGFPGWRARFSPLIEGEHEAVVRIRDAAGEHVSAPVRFKATAATKPGYVRVSREDPRFLELRQARSDRPGRPFFPIGQNLAFIGQEQYVSLDRAEEIFGKLAANGANYLRIWTCCQDWAIAIEARKSAFGRSWEGRKSLVVPCPDDPARECVRLSPTNATLRLNPSHRIALKPGADYRLTGRWRGLRAGLVLEVHGQRVAWPTPTGTGWQPFTVDFRAGDTERWLGTVLLAMNGAGEVFLTDLSLKESGGSAELLWEADLNRPAIGIYNQPDCFMLDELVRAAEQNGIYLQLCLLTRDLYMDRLKNPASAEYAQAIEDAKRFLRYAVARWGYSTAIAGWEYWNEMDPGKPTDRFYRELGAHLEATDIYAHLKSTSTWGPSARDCRLEALTVADTHFYLRPGDEARLPDEVQAVLDRAAWLRQQAPGKPALLGEFGIADNQWRLRPEMNRTIGLPDVHNALWASALSGLSGTAMQWWWERLDQQEAYTLYRPLSRFLADVPWTTGQLQPLSGTSTNTALQLVGLQSRGEKAWAWVFHKEAAWRTRTEGHPVPPVNGAIVKLRGLKPGTWEVEWVDTRKGDVVKRDLQSTKNGMLGLVAPGFEGDEAFRLRWLSETLE